MAAFFEHTFLVLLIVLMITSTILVSSSINSVLRQRRPRISLPPQKTDKRKTGFYVLSVFLITGATVLYIPNKIALVSTLGCYFWIGSMITISHILTSRSYVSAMGISTDINNPAGRVTWPQILDLAERKMHGGSEFTFSYTNRSKSLSGGIKRMKIFVPEPKRHSFEKIVSLKLNNRFDNSGLPKIDLKNLQTG